MPTIEQRLNRAVGDLQTQLPTAANAEEAQGLVDAIINILVSRARGLWVVLTDAQRFDIVITHGLSTVRLRNTYQQLRGFLHGRVDLLQYFVESYQGAR